MEINENVYRIIVIQYGQRMKRLQRSFLEQGGIGVIFLEIEKDHRNLVLSTVDSNRMHPIMMVKCTNMAVTSVLFEQSTHAPCIFVRYKIKDNYRLLFTNVFILNNL